MNLKTLKDVIEEEIRQARSRVRGARKMILNHAKEISEIHADVSGYSQSLINRSIQLQVAEAELAILLETQKRLSELET